MNNKKNVVLFIDSLGSGGAQRQLVNLAVSLKKKNYNVTVVVYLEKSFYKEILDKNEVPVVSCTGNKFTRIFRVRRKINSLKPDVVIAFLEGACFMACISKIGKKWKLITTERSAKESTFTSRRNKFFNKFEKYSDIKIANSYNAINMWKKYFPKYSDRYHVIYNGTTVPEELINSDYQYRKNGKLNLVVAASYQGLKNPIAVVEAVNLLTDEQKNQLCINWYGQPVVAGNTEIFDTAKANAEKYGLTETIKFNNETNEIYKKMSESDAVGLFSTVEGLPNVICEGMMLGKPIVMSKVSDYDILVNGNGYLCDPNSIESIKDALVSIINTPVEDLTKMGNKSRAMAKELFCIDVVECRWLEYIEGVM